MSGQSFRPVGTRIVQRVKVLVVDDSPGIRSRLVSLLREVAGVATAEASGAEEALEHLRARGADTVVLDLHMPGKNGLEIIRDLKAAEPAPMVIVLTSHPTDHHRRLCLELGADHFFDKAREFGRVVELLAGPTVRRR